MARCSKAQSFSAPPFHWRVPSRCASRWRVSSSRRRPRDRAPPRRTRDAASSSRTRPGPPFPCMPQQTRPMWPTELLSSVNANICPHTPGMAHSPEFFRWIATNSRMGNFVWLSCVLFPELSRNHLPIHAKSFLGEL